MKIEAVEAFYLRMPEVRDVGDGSQDALLIRVSADGFVGWGECEASPLATIGALVGPMSHSACHPVLDSVLGQELDGPQSVRRIYDLVRMRSADLLQASHALSGIDIALWDLLGRRETAPVWSFFGGTNLGKVAYASLLFGAQPEDTFRAAAAVDHRFKAAKLGWGPIGEGSVEEDRLQLAAAREGLGPDRLLMVDTGCVFGHDVDRALDRISLFEEFNVKWWEEPFSSGALSEYAALSKRTTIPLAAGEGAHNPDMGKHYLDYGRVGFVQIDAGRVGGITGAREVAEYAHSVGKSYVNHTFTSNLALSASLQPYADRDGFAEVPTGLSSLATAIGGPRWDISSDGRVFAPNAPGLGVDVELEALQPYLQEVQIQWNGKTLWPL